jgi:hypothetical protein
MKKIRNNIFYILPEEELRKTFSTFRGIGNANVEFDNLTKCPGSLKLKPITTPDCIQTSEITQNKVDWAAESG